MNEQMAGAALYSPDEFLQILQQAATEAQNAAQVVINRREKLTAELVQLNKDLEEIQGDAQRKRELLETAQQVLLTAKPLRRQEELAPSKGATLIGQVQRTALDLLISRSHVSTREIAVTLFSEAGVTKKIQSQISTIMCTHPDFKADGRKGWVKVESRKPCA